MIWGYPYFRKPPCGTFTETTSIYKFSTSGSFTLHECDSQCDHVRGSSDMICMIMAMQTQGLLSFAFGGDATLSCLGSDFGWQGVSKEFILLNRRDTLKYPESS